MASAPGIHFALEPRLLKLIQQQERYNWFARNLESRAKLMTVAQIIGLLEDPRPTWPAQREKALVLLALKGNVEAGDAIALFDPGDDETMEIFHAVVADEWARAAQ